MSFEYKYIYYNVKVYVRWLIFDSKYIKKSSCNNVGGMKGSGGCNGGSYAVFESLDAGIEAMISNLSRNYIQQGLVTPEQINTKYATSTTWASKVNNYIEKVRNA